MTGRAPARAGFTLVELLVVVSIIALALAMIAFLPSGARKDAEVQAAAQELASTLRLARSLSMDKKAIYGVSFNIQNSPGTSGKVLNNWSGGHWYQILAPTDETWTGGGNEWPMYPRPVDNQFSRFLQNVKTSAYGDRHVLSPRRVRFLALGDQDNGGFILSRWPFSMAYPDQSYPRPWFGYYDAAAKRLRPWGGYDPAIAGSAFCYQGGEGTITGSLNPVTKMCTDDPSCQIYAAGTPRPVINGEWVDFAVEFMPDGSARQRRPFDARVRGWDYGLPITARTSGNAYMASDWQPGEDHWRSGGNSAMWFRPNAINDYHMYTGWWTITLGPDSERDNDEFGSAKGAYDSLMPAYRVMYNRYGAVKVVKVGTGYAGSGSGALDPKTPSGAQWTDWTYISAWYAQNLPTNGKAQELRGYPIDDYLTPALLASRNWWMTGP